MANITKRKNRDGTFSYRIRVYKGEDTSGKALVPYVMTWKPAPKMTQRQIEKELTKQANDFEEKCKTGEISDNKQTFEQYADYVLKLKERTGIKHRTIVRYRDILNRINQGIGYLKLKDIKPQHLNNLYEQLAQEGIRKNNEKCICKINLKEDLKQKGLLVNKLCEKAHISQQTYRTASNMKPISIDKAKCLCNTLGMPLNEVFKTTINNTPLSNKTILEHHRLISTILNQAEKEMLIMYNPARKATPPKAETTHANYFQPQDIDNIRECLKNEPLKWQTIIHLLLITGARRGELCGLKWEVIEWSHNKIHICNNLLYTPDRGIYEDTTKTESSDRYITLPNETMVLLKKYRQWYLKQATACGDRWHNTNYLFFQEKSGNEGKPICPDTITDWCNNFSRKYNLPHINPHAFRHTMASLLYFSGADSVSISKRLGHSKVSTTTDIYSHIIQQADEQNAEKIADAVLRPNKIKA